jgi:hypothetical protein
VFSERVTVLCGHFGSGKTEIAANLALDLAARGVAVALADLDVVKPYFRSRSTRELMAAAGVRMIMPRGELLTADLPVLVPEIRTALRDPSARLVLDVGGDDTGARILGALSDVIPRADTALLLVLNFRRPFTEDAAAAVAMAREISLAARLPIAGILSNTHLMDETTPELVAEGCALARSTAALLGVPMLAAGADERLVPALDATRLGCPVLGLRRLLRPPFEQPRGRTSGPLFVLS